MLGGSAPESAPGQLAPAGHDGATIVTCGVLVVITVVAWAQVVSVGHDARPHAGHDHAAHVFWRARIRGGLDSHDGGDDAAERTPDDRPLRCNPAKRGRSGPKDAASGAVHARVPWRVGGDGRSDVLREHAAGCERCRGARVRHRRGAGRRRGLPDYRHSSRVCLRHCRSPLGFFLGHWRAGWRGGLTMGWAHAALLPRVLLGPDGGPGRGRGDGPPLGLAYLGRVAAEKLLPGGSWIARGVGLALVFLGMAVAMRPDWPWR